MAGPLAQKIRAKFPGVYDDMDDATLEAKILAKHPEYADLAGGEGKTIGGALKAAGKGVIEGMGYGPLKAGYETFVKPVVDDPVGAISDVAAQGGAMGGAALGAPLGPVGMLAGGVIGAAVGGGGGQAVENRMKARPVGEGVVGEAALQGGVQALPVVGKAVGGALKGAGRWAMGRSIGPPVSILNKMAEARQMTPQQLRGYLADVSYQQKIAPTGAGLLKAVSKVNANSAEQKAMERAAGEAGRSINMRDTMKRVKKDALKYKKPEATIPNIEADTRPMAAINATKAALNETATQNPNLSVPFESVRTRTQQGAGLLPEESISVRRGAIPNPESDPSVVGDVRRGVNAKLVDAYGIDPETKAGIMVDKAWAAETGKDLSAATKDMGKRAYGDIGGETHDILNLMDAVRQRSYNSATNPVRLYEFLGAISGNVPAITLGMASRPPVLWNAGKGARQMGEHVATASGINPALIRAALLARLGQQPE